MKTLLISCLLLCSNMLLAQIVIPPAIKKGNNVTCSQDKWQLVFRDDFNGEINRKYWNTFESWLNMEPNDHDNWEEGRIKMGKINDTFFAREVILDKNVEIKNGKCYLKAYKEPASWKCFSCIGPEWQSQFTAASLNLNFRHHNLNHGKINVRAKIPNFDYGHHAIWLWYGVNCNNEIDIIEAYGARNTYNARNPYATYNTHEWNNATRQCSDDVVRLWKKKTNEPQHVDGSLINIGGYERTFMKSVYKTNRFQRPANWFNRTYRPEQIFDMEEYHTYGVAFDEHHVFFYLDNYQIAQIPKYYKKVGGRKVIPQCEETATLYMNNGFPWDTESHMQFRMGIGMHNTVYKDQKYIDALPDGFLGAMEIDYVEIMQQYENGNWQFQHTSQVNPSIIGDSILQPNKIHTYALSDTSVKGKWVVSPHFKVVQQSDKYIKVQANEDVFHNGWIALQPSDSTMHELVFPVAKIIPDTETLKIVTINSQQGQVAYLFDTYAPYQIATNERERMQYSWHITYTHLGLKETIIYEGNYVALPQHWQLKDVTLNVIMEKKYPDNKGVVLQTSHQTNNENNVTISDIITEEIWVNEEAYVTKWQEYLSETLYYEYEISEPKYLSEIEHFNKILAAYDMANNPILSQSQIK